MGVDQVSEPTAPAVGQVACSISSTLIRHVRSTHGDDKVAEMLSRSGAEHSAEFLSDLGNWIWYDEMVALIEAAAQVTGDEQVGLRAGNEAVRQHAGTAVATLLRSLGSPERICEQLSQAATKFTTVSQMEPVEVGPGRAVVHVRTRPGFERHRLLCDYTKGMLSQPPALFGLPPAAVAETTCAVRGDDHCSYTVTWDAKGAADAADPQAVITALEGQVAAMTARLDSMYATARDLIAPDDVDSALSRITERAASAVRAPRYLLAVRTGSDHELRVHHRGFDGEDADQAGQALLDGGVDHFDGTRVVAEVKSSVRHYGRLMAASPAGGFFGHERDLLEVYATYAATVLDTATAFHDARVLHRRSLALLELSQTLASTTTADEVARVLAEVVPAVVDCDRASIFLWSGDDQAMRCAAVTGVAEEVVRSHVVSAQEEPGLLDEAEAPDPAPRFYDLGCDDAAMLELMERFGSVALVAVPIVARDRFYGFLNVAVTNRPQRLRRSDDLVEALAAIVAQAATGLDNARLIEQMAHDARHDNLTGLLGHRAFHESLADHAAGAEPEFALAVIDIDDFKHINDTHGHPVGDQALRQVADALRASVRERDTVFRVGGEEFAVLLPGADAEDAQLLMDRLREAVASVPFVSPLQVSVGVASCLGHACDVEALLCSADEALYAAKRGGKNQTVLATA